MAPRITEVQLNEKYQFAMIEINILSNVIIALWAKAYVDEIKAALDQRRGQFVTMAIKQL